MYERGGDERGDEGACMVASPPLAIETNGWVVVAAAGSRVYSTVTGPVGGSGS